MSTEVISGDERIIRFAEAAKDRDVLSRRPRNVSACKHRPAEIDVEARRVYCGDCGVELDPITVLSKLYEWSAEVQRAYERNQLWDKRRLEEELEKKRTAAFQARNRLPDYKQGDHVWLTYGTPEREEGGHGGLFVRLESGDIGLYWSEPQKVVFSVSPERLLTIRRMPGKFRP